MAGGARLWHKAAPVRRLAFVTGLLALVLVAPYAAAPSYDFPERRPFSGDRWHNPYEGWRGPFRKVNLHAHSRAWLGLTSGRNTPREMAQAYADWGFEALALSDYHRISTVEDAPLPMLRAYEHGINLNKSHRLVLGARRVLAFDFPIATRATRQWALDALSQPEALVAVNHPSLRQGHGCAELEALTGYQLVEVHNAYATSLFEWDCALSAGRLAWAIGNDDSHATREEGIGVAWNMVGVEEVGEEREVLAALGAGRSYVVRGERGRMDVHVVEVGLGGDGAMTVELDGPARVEWLSEGGTVRQVEEGVSVSRFVPAPGTRYVRAVVRTPITELVLNPFVRAGAWQPPVAQVSWPKTVLGWATWLAAAVGLAWLGRRRRGLALVRPARAA